MAFNPAEQTDKFVATDGTTGVVDNFHGARIERHTPYEVTMAQIEENSRQAREIMAGIVAALKESGLKDHVVAGFATHWDNHETHPLYAAIMSDKC